MAELEKRAWFELSIILITLAVYVAMISFVRFDSVSLAVFALAGFLGVRRRKARGGEVLFDERDRQIERQALLYSLMCLYCLMLLFSVVAGVIGWDGAVPIWILIQIFWAVSLVVWGLKAAFVIISYRRGAHA